MNRIQLTVLLARLGFSSVTAIALSADMWPIALIAMEISLVVIHAKQVIISLALSVSLVQVAAVSVFRGLSQAALLTTILILPTLAFSVPTKPTLQMPTPSLLV